MEKTKIILDTNILISALGWQGNPNKILNLVIERKLEIIISDDQFAELSQTLDYPRLEFTEEQKDRIKSLVLEIGIFVKPLEKINLIKSDPDDNMHLEAAVVGNAKYIVTGDQDLLSIKEFRGIKIVTAKEFLEIFKDYSI